MRILNYFINTFFAVGILFAGNALAQPGTNPVPNNVLQGPIPAFENGVLDGVYVQEHIPTKRAIAYQHLREADALWTKRIWRIIDLREKINFSLYYPIQPMSDRWSLFDILRGHIEKSEPDITLYQVMNPEDINILDGDQFKYPVFRTPGLPYEEDSVYLSKMRAFLYHDSEESTVQLQTQPDEFGQSFDSVDVNGQAVYAPTIIDPISAGDIIQYRLKEDWFFDKQRSVLDVRVLGICPVIFSYATPAREKIVGLRELFWVYYPECRYILQNYFVYNRKNDARRISFDDLFWKRQFGSIIYRSTNVYNRNIREYETGIETLLESDKVKGEIFKFEHDLWHL